MKITDPRLYYIDENYCTQNLMIKSLNVVSTLTSVNVYNVIRQNKIKVDSQFLLSPSLNYTLGLGDKAN